MTHRDSTEELTLFGRTGARPGARALALRDVALRDVWADGLWADGERPTSCERALQARILQLRAPPARE